MFQKTKPEITKLPFDPSQEVKIEKMPGDPNKPLTFVQYVKGETKDPWVPSLGGDLKSNEDKELFLEGFSEESEQPQNKTQNKDAIEFGVDSETYKILQDLSKRWYATSDSAEKDRLHEVAEEVRRLARGNNRVKYGTDEIFDVMHKNAKEALQHQNEYKQLTSNPFLGQSGINYFFDSSGYLIGQVNHGPWDYKLQESWWPKETYIDKNDGSRRYDGKNLDLYDQKNYIPWIYFDGYLIGADKFGNMNMAYVGKKMGLPEWVYKNFTTKDKDDPFWVQYGIDLAESGR